MTRRLTGCHVHFNAWWWLPDGASARISTGFTHRRANQETNAQLDALVEEGNRSVREVCDGVLTQSSSSGTHRGSESGKPRVENTENAESKVGGGQLRVAAHAARGRGEQEEARQ